MEKKRTKKQIDNKLAQVQAKLKEYKGKLKRMPIILFTVLYSFIFTMVFPVGGVIGIIKALIGGIGSISTAIYFWRYREVIEPKYENYVKFLEEESQTLLEELKELELHAKQEVSNQPKLNTVNEKMAQANLLTDHQINDSNSYSL